MLGNGPWPASVTFVTAVSQVRATRQEDTFPPISCLSESEHSSFPKVWAPRVTPSAFSGLESVHSRVR